MRVALCSFALFLSLFATVAVADDVTAAQGVIRQQLEALSRDDAVAAYSFASPGIRRLYPQSDAFLAMVKRNFAPVYRHKSFEFGEAGVSGDSVVQRARIIDNDGDLWDALYTIEQQSDGTFKISGCVLLKIADSV